MQRDCIHRLVTLGVILWSTATVASGQTPSDSQPRLELGGSLRTRFELKEDFRFGAPDSSDPDIGDEELFLTQLRLRLTWRPSDSMTIVVELQDARLFNESEALDDDATPNVLADDLDLHQAYLEADFDLRGLPGRLRLGRQKLDLGAQRLVAALEWVNTARVWDAARLTLGSADRRTLDIFVSRLVPVRPGAFNDWARTPSRHWNSGFHGLYYTDHRSVEDGRWELYYLLRHESEVDDRIHTLGTRLELRRRTWDFHGEIAWQGGHRGRLDHEAAAAHLELGVGPGTWMAGRFHLAYNFASGDDDPTDTTHQTFDNLYPLNHAYYGAMDFFSWQNVHNLEAAWRHTLPSRLRARFAYQVFWLAETEDAWYDAGGAVVRRGSPTADSQVGSELDVTVSMPFALGGHAGSLEVGYGHFFAGDFVTDTGPADDADFFYLQSRITF